MRKGILDIVKGTPSHRIKAQKAHEIFDRPDRFTVTGDNPDLVKGGGWTPVPNTKHHGLRKRNAKGAWDYWYKDQISYKAGKRQGEHNHWHNGQETASGDKMHVGPERHDALVVHHQARADASRDDFKGDNSHADNEAAATIKHHNAMRMASEASLRGDPAEQVKMTNLAAKHRKEAVAANDLQSDEYHAKQAEVRKLDKKVISHHRSSRGQEVKVVAHVGKDGEALGHSIEQSWDAAKPTNRDYAGGAHGEPTVSGHSTLESAEDHAAQIMGGGSSPYDKATKWTKKAVDDTPDLVKGGGPFIGKRGGKWADSKHTIAWKEGKSPSKQRKHAHGGSSRGFLNDHKNTTADEHSGLAQKHRQLSEASRSASRKERDGSNAHFAHEYEAQYHDSMTNAHQHMKVGKNSYRGMDAHDERSATQARTHAAEMKQWSGEAHEAVEASRPPRNGRGDLHSMGNTGTGKKMAFLSRENFRDHTDDWSPEDHDEAANEHRARAEDKWERSDALQAEGKWEEASRHNRAGRYHDQLDRVHSHAALGGTNETPHLDPGDRGNLKQAAHAQSVSTTERLTDHAGWGTRKAMGDNHDLVKGKGGWQPIPGGKHGGERKRGSYGHWEYRYASKESAKQAADHHESKRKAVHDKIEAHDKEYDFDSPSFNWDKYDEHGEAESEKLSNDHSHHADQRDAARHFAQHGHGPATYLASHDSHGRDHDGEYDDEERQRGWTYAHPKNDTHGYTVTQRGDKNKFEVHHGERHGHGHVEPSEKVGTARSREAAMALLHRHSKTAPVKKAVTIDLQKAIVAYDQAIENTNR